MNALRLVYPRDPGLSDTEGFLLAVHGLLGTPSLLAAPKHVVIEFRGSARGIEATLFASTPALLSPLAAAFAAAYAGGACEPLDSPTRDAAWARGLRRLRLGANDVPLRTKLPVPGLLGVLTSLGRLASNQQVVLQLALSPAPRRAQANLMCRATPATGKQARQGLSELFAGNPAAGPRVRAMRDKASSPLFHASVLVAATTPALAEQVRAGFAQFATSYAQVHSVPIFLPGRARRQLAARRPGGPLATVLAGTAELSAIFAPTGETLRRVRGPVVRSRRVAPPAGASTQGRLICISNAGTPRRVALKRADTRLHTWLLGPTGTGKSTLMAGHVLDAASRGDGVILLDPKGDLVDAVLRRLPEKRARDVIVLDPIGEAAFPVGLNLLEPGPGQDAASVTDSIVAVMRDLFERNWGARTEDTLYNGIFTAAGRPGTTLAELPRLYADAGFRAPFVAALTDPFVREFWTAYDRITPGERATITAPVLNKLRPLLRPDLAPIIGQPRSTVDLSRVLAERKILLVRLPRDGALFGALLVARLWQAASRRSSLPENRRPDCLLAIDEVHAFLRTGGDLSEMLAMARGLRLSLCMASQHLEQCPPRLRAALLANARTRVVFQTDEADAAQLARGLAPHLEADDLTNLGRYEVAVRMAVDGTVAPPFTGRTLPLPDPVRADTRALRAQSRKRYARPRAEVEAELRQRLGDAAPGAVNWEGIDIGRRPS